MVGQNEKATAGSPRAARMVGSHGPAFLTAYFTSEAVMKRVMESLSKNTRLLAMVPRGTEKGWQLTTTWQQLPNWH